MSDWLDEVPVEGAAMKQVQEAVRRFKKAEFDLNEAEDRLTYAKNVYNKVVQEVSQMLRQNGLESVRTEDGSTLEVTTAVRCSIKKDEDSKKEVADWLRNRGMESLVTSQLIVPTSQSSFLLLHNIPFDSSVSLNTNSVKAYVQGELRVGNLERREIPKGLSWFEYESIKVTDVK